MKNQLAKALFGLVIFLFSVALAYFTANYLSTNNLFDYWGTIAIFAGVYVVIGMAVSMIFSISLGFLFAADVLILNLLYKYYGNWADALKLLVIGIILIVLYVVAYVGLRDRTESAPPASS